MNQNKSNRPVQSDPARAILRDLVSFSPFTYGLDSRIRCHYCGVTRGLPHAPFCVWLRANALVEPVRVETVAEDVERRH